ncbi:sulfite oxidase [Streptomyces sp. BE303]|uniref:sulfite oxidase n=1 Tax=Streptomycetaceae TaxID=2062 RepID=UPI002E777E2C|nr:sulfite oxidase [Streptomyces sp. BE303]MED7947466.1 sulfite oxidase [Streptomyces sp. BE303]
MSGSRTRWRPDTVTERPYNAQTPPAALAEPLTPTGAFFVRDHFGVPRLTPERWRLRIHGLVERELSLTYAELELLPVRELDVVVECAGNGRSLMRPRPPGLPWDQGAVGCARFAGVPLAVLADRAGVRPEAVELVFTGADFGELHGRRTAFERSLPVDLARHPDTLLATRMNGTLLSPGHGAPVRLVVPGRYGVADVKWLVGVRAVAEPFHGPFQAEEYLYRGSRGMPDGTPEGPVGEIRVRSLITAPSPGARLPAGGACVVRGRAWSGGVPVCQVEVRIGGADWRQAVLVPAGGRYAWAEWWYQWTPRVPGRRVLQTRATDADGHTQPMRAPWNEQGYGCNPVTGVAVEVVAAPDGERPAERDGDRPGGNGDGSGGGNGDGSDRSGDGVVGGRAGRRGARR